MTTTVIRALAVTAAASAAAISFAGFASADPLQGTFLRVMGDSGGMFQSTVTYTSCGPDCIHGQTSGPAAYDLHSQGGVWTGGYALKSGAACSVTLDPAAMTEHHVCPPNTDVVMTLTPA